MKKNIHDDILFLSYNPFENYNFTNKIWSYMLDKCPHSFFLSWGWISTWINSLPTDSDINLIVGYIREKPIISFFICRNKSLRHGLFPTRQLSLNTSANTYFDSLCIEYNSILVDSSFDFQLKHIIESIPLHNWDEFLLHGITPDYIDKIDIFKNIYSKKFNIIIDGNINSFYVDLKKIRENKINYLQLISSNKRQQIRRSIKQYEKKGKIQIRQAESSDEALYMLDRLAELHQKEWVKRGMTGAFSNSYFYQFHKKLIKNRFHDNEIQLLHIFNKNMTLGYIYNFVYKKTVLFYQSGFNYLPKNIYRPGLVSHYFAINYNIKKNYYTYDFLAGDSQYKKSLATGSTMLLWVRIQKKRKRFWIENNLKKIRTGFRSILYR